MFGIKLSQLMDNSHGASPRTYLSKSKVSENITSVRSVINIAEFRGEYDKLIFFGAKELTNLANNDKKGRYNGVP